MNQEELKQRLIELIDKKVALIDLNDSSAIWTSERFEELSDYLIANGVTIREHGEWIKRTQCSEPECSKCGRCPKLVFGMLPDFCPHCGVDMRGVKDE